MRKSLLLLVLILTAGPPLPAAVPGRPLSSPVATPRPSAGHKHRWVRSTRKVWVPPRYEKRLVGYDEKGRPIYRRVLVAPGHWKTVYVLRCAVCGRIKH